MGPAQRHILGLAAELGVATARSSPRGLTLLELGGRRHGYRRDPPRLSPVQLADAGRAIFALDRMARRVPVQAPWQGAGAAAADPRRWRTGPGATSGRGSGGSRSRPSARGCSPASRVRSRSCTCCSTCGRRAGSGSSPRPSGAAQQDRFAGGVAADRDQDGRAARPGRRPARRPGDADRAGAVAGHRARGRRGGRRAPGRDRRAARAGRADRLRPAAARRPRPAHPGARRWAR